MQMNVDVAEQCILSSIIWFLQSLVGTVYSSGCQPLWDRGPVNSFLHKTRAQSQQIYSSVPFQFFF